MVAPVRARRLLDELLDRSPTTHREQLSTVLLFGLASFGARAAHPSPRLARMCAGVPCASAAARLEAACPACIVPWAMRPLALTRVIYRAIPSQAIAIYLELVPSADQAHRVHHDSRDRAGRGHCDRADRVAGAPLRAVGCVGAPSSRTAEQQSSRAAEQQSSSSSSSSHGRWQAPR